MWGLVFGLTWNLKRSDWKITKYSITFVRLVRHITFLDQVCHRGWELEGGSGKGWRGKIKRGLSGLGTEWTSDLVGGQGAFSTFSCNSFGYLNVCIWMNFVFFDPPSNLGSARPYIGDGYSWGSKGHPSILYCSMILSLVSKRESIKTAGKDQFWLQMTTKRFSHQWDGFANFDCEIL